MQIKINKDIRHYQEDVFMGLSLRQALCSAIAVGVAVGVYFGVQPLLGHETVSWVCIVCAAPVAAAGFFQYDGLTFEQFLLAALRSEVTLAGPRIWKSENALYTAWLRSKAAQKRKPLKGKSKKGGPVSDIA